jgi:Ca2+:H+ antiporter
LFFSEGIAAIMIVLYGLSLVYSLSNPQARLLADAEEVEEAGGNVLGEVATPAEPAAHHASVQRALIVLALATVGIVLMSELLVSTVEPVAHGLGLSEFFVGLIIIPIIGNVAEHFVAVQVAMKNRMDLSLAISLGSSLQIALFVAPVLVFLSLFFPDNLLLVFNQYELLGLATASITTALVSQDGESNWLEGVQLLTVYTILAMAFYLLPSTATTH